MKQLKTHHLQSANDVPFSEIKGKPHLLVLLEPCVTEIDYESKMEPLMKKHLDPKSLSISVVCSSAGFKILKGKYEKYYLVRHRFTSSNDMVFLFEYCWYLFLSFFKLVQATKSTKAHVIVSLSGHAYSGLVVSVVARILHRKSIVRISEPTMYITRGRYRFSSIVSTLVHIAESFTFRLCNVIISNRDMTWYHSKVRLKQRILSQGVDLALFDRQVKPALNSKAFPKLITVSRLDKQKNISGVIEAIKLLKEEYPAIAYHIVGVGPDEENLKKEVKALELSDNVIFHGYVKPEHVASLLRSCDLFVLPSVIESVPSAVLEAMACGIPVVLGSTRYDYVSWFVNEGNVLLVSGNPESIAQSIIRITSDNELKRKLVLNAFEHVKKYHNSSNTRIQFTKIVKELLES